MMKMADENLKKVNADSENLKKATRAENLKKFNYLLHQDILD